MTPLVLGIAGGTASGKTTLARRVAVRLGDDCLHLLHDRYYLTMPEAFRDRPTEYNFDHPDALDTARLVADLDALRRGQVTLLPDYDYTSHRRRDEDERVEPRPILLVEGILVLADRALRERFHHRVYVHAPDDIRLIRRIKRDAISRGRTPLQTIDQYERTVRPMHELYVAPSRAHAELIIDGCGDLEAGVEAVLRLIGR